MLFKTSVKNVTVVLLHLKLTYTDFRISSWITRYISSPNSACTSRKYVKMLYGLRTIRYKIKYGLRTISENMVQGRISSLWSKYEL